MKIFLFFIGIILIAQHSYAQEDLSEVYDENTEITISGTITDVMLPKKGPTLLRLKLRKMTYLVVTAPHWYLAQQDIIFKQGLILEVKGSKYFSREGNIYIIGSEIKFQETGKKIILRDKYLRPLWRGHGMHRGKP